jgi:adenylylsulfate kinase-like enzyme
MLKGRIYWFTGEVINSKELGKKLHNLLQSEKRNWRRDVFYLDDSTSSNINHLQMIAEYLHTSGCDVVVSAISPHKSVRESFKNKIGISNFSEFYVHNSKNPLDITIYEEPTENFISVDLHKSNTTLLFGSIVNYLIDNNKL